MTDFFNEFIDRLNYLIKAIQPLERLNSILETIKTFPDHFVDIINKLQQEYHMELNQDEIEAMEDFKDFATKHDITLNDVIENIDKLKKDTQNAQNELVQRSKQLDDIIDGR